MYSVFFVLLISHWCLWIFTASNSFLFLWSVWLCFNGFPLYCDMKMWTEIACFYLIFWDQVWKWTDFMHLINILQSHWFHSIFSVNIIWCGRNLYSSWNIVMQPFTNADMLWSCCHGNCKCTGSGRLITASESLVVIFI